MASYLNQCISAKTRNQIDHCDETKKEYSWLIPHCKPELKYGQNMTGYEETFKSLHAEVDLKHCHIKEIKGHVSYNWPVNEYIIWQSQKNDLQNIKRNIKALANNQEQIIDYLDVSLSVLNQTRKLLKTRRTKISKPA